jgi:hypothetical protein
MEVLAGGGRWADAAPTRASDHDFDLAPEELVDVMCECGHSTCTGTIVMSLDEYRAVRLHPTRFVIKEGHEVAEVVRVVGHGPDHVVVAKCDLDASSVRSL